jgi:hypothetical protein
MKKILTIVAVVAAGTLASYSQGLVSIAQNLQIISTNGPTTGRATTSGAYNFELLTMASPTVNSNSLDLNGTGKLASACNQTCMQLIIRCSHRCTQLYTGQHRFWWLDKGKRSRLQ